jgi:cell division protein FtsL
MKKDKLLIIISGLIVILSLVQLFISHSLAAAGEKVGLLENRAKQLEFENAILEEEIAKTGSLSRISEEAERLGFIKSGKAIHLTPQLPVAWGY